MQIDTAQANVVKLIESTLQLSNLDLVTSYVFKGDKSAPMLASSTIRNDILGPSFSEAQVSVWSSFVWN